MRKTVNDYENVFSFVEYREIKDFIKDKFVNKIKSHNYSDIYTALLKAISKGIYEAEVENFIGDWNI